MSLAVARIAGQVVPGVEVARAWSAASVRNGVAAANGKFGFIPAALETSWSMLGHYAGNQAAARRWPRMKASKADAVQGTEERRARFDSASGPAVGVTTPFELGDRQLITTWALDSEVDDALTRGRRPEDVLAAQQAFAEKLDGIASDERAADKPEAPGSTPRASDPLVPGEPIESAMPDGSIFSLRVR